MVFLHTQEILKKNPFDALENGNFKVFLQPKLSAKTHRVVGAEFLSRYISDEGEIIMPNQYIPEFEQNGFIRNLDISNFEQLCVFLGRWEELFGEDIEKFPISINFSKSHFMEQSLLITLDALLNKYKVSPQLIEIEITETAPMDNIENFRFFVKKLREYGFQCSLDDFGTYTSSLRVLKEIDIDVLKIDRAYICDSKENKNYIILKIIMDLAKNLKIKTVAEGVETKNQLEILEEVGCDMLQGWYFSKALPVEEFTDYVKRINLEEK